MKNFVFLKAVLLALIFATLFTACPPTPYYRSVEDVKRGMLVSYTDRRAVADVWGPPDTTRILKGEAILFRWSSEFGGSSGTISSDRLYDVWEYKSRGVTLFFDGYYLINWITDKTTHELRSN
jgi:hypothetical protein